jgi:hypothetical protein
MGVVELNRIQTKLKKLFEGKIDLSDAKKDLKVPNKTGL